MWRKESQLSLSLSHINLPKFLLSTIGKESNKTNIDKKCYYFTQGIKKKSVIIYNLIITNEIFSYRLLRLEMAMG